MPTLTELARKVEEAADALKKAKEEAAKQKVVVDSENDKLEDLLDKVEIAQKALDRANSNLKGAK